MKTLSFLLVLLTALSSFAHQTGTLGTYKNKVMTLSRGIWTEAGCSEANGVWDEEMCFIENIGELVLRENNQEGQVAEGLIINPNGFGCGFDGKFEVVAPTKLIVTDNDAPECEIELNLNSDNSISLEVAPGANCREVCGASGYMAAEGFFKI